MGKDTRTRVTAYVRRHHFTTHPGRPSHSKFLNILTHVETYGDFSVDDYENADESWQKIKQTLKDATDEQINQIEIRMRAPWR